MKKSYISDIIFIRQGGNIYALCDDGYKHFYRYDYRS